MSKDKCGTKEEEVKKLILVGNGCDLAMGLPTRYQDFLLWLIKKYILETLETGPNKLIKKNPFKNHQNVYGHKIEVNQIIECIIENPCHKELKELKNELNECSSLAQINELNKKFKIYFKDRGKYEKITPFLLVIFNDSYSGWVDIEEMYFKRLKKIIDINQYGDHNLELLNQELTQITKDFQNYLITQVEGYFSDIPLPLQSKIANQFRASTPPEGGYKNYSPESGKDENIFLVNFNYTKSLVGGPFKEMNHIHIHGNVDDEMSEIIFGYGDEMDEDYKMIENLNKNEYLEKFKSFGYFRSPEYRQLLKIVNSGPFDVVIYGHSCGLSDRVLLNEIFEHKNCRYIRVYYYRDKKNYIDKTMNISRHFNCKQLMRQRVINFQEEDRIPQVG